MRPPRRTLLVLLALVLSVLAVQTAAATGDDETPPTLQGEELFQPIGTDVTFNCNPGGISTVSWTASGTASGPFNGTFTATGTATIGPQTFGDPIPIIPGTLAGPILSFEETFEITSVSPPATITGTKTHQPGQDIQQSQGTCDALGLVVVLATQPLYEATIEQGSDSDEVAGEANVSLFGFPGPSSFSQVFLSSTPLCDEDDQGDQDEDPGCDDDDDEQ
jgi:hypothetical protein